MTDSSNPSDAETSTGHGAPHADESSPLPSGFAGEDTECVDDGFTFSDMTGGRESRSDVFESLPAEFGRYRVLSCLGGGGMGTVYLAEDTRLERNVALKLPRFDGDDGSLAARFRREAKAAATLHHPNVCSVFDVGEIDGRHFLAMEYVNGHSLAERIKSGERFTDEEAAEFVRKAARAFREAHQRGIVHRDVKPGNIMLTLEGEPKITDFGLAQRTENDATQITLDGQILGTPAYMSPEQVEGDPDGIGPASDVYALGVVLYELLAGRRPFSGPTAALLVQIATADLPAPSEFRVDVDPALEAICLRMLARERAERFASMDEVGEALGAWLAGERAPAVGEEAVATPPSRKPRVDSLLGGLAIALLVFGGLWFLRPGSDTGENGDPSDPITPTPIAENPDDEPDPVEPLGVVEDVPRTPLPDGPPGEVAKFAGSKSSIRDVEFHPDGRTVGSVSENGTLRIWDLASGKVRYTWQNWSFGGGLAFSADGQFVASPLNQTDVGVWDTTTGARHRVLSGHAIAVSAVAFSPDGGELASGTRDGHVWLWDLETGEPEHRLPPLPNRVCSLVYAADGRRLLYASAKAYMREGEPTLAAWDTEEKREVWRGPSRWNHDSLSPAPDDRMLAFSGWNRLYLLDVLGFDEPDHRAARRVDVHMPSRITQQGNALAFTPDGQHVVVGCDDRTIRFVDVSTRQEVFLFEADSHVTAHVDVSPDGRFVVSGGGRFQNPDGKFDDDGDYALRIWRMPRLPSTTVVLPTSEVAPRTWRFTAEKPTDGWLSHEFDDAEWSTGPGPFAGGDERALSRPHRTPWFTPRLWARQTFRLDEVPEGELRIHVHYDDLKTIYLNGKRVFTVPAHPDAVVKAPKGHSTQYETFPLGPAADFLVRGENVIAMYGDFENGRGGRRMDAGLSVRTEPDPE